MPESTTSDDVTPEPEPQAEPVQPVILTGGEAGEHNTGDGPSSNDAPQFPAGENPIEPTDADGPSSNDAPQFPAGENPVEPSDADGPSSDQTSGQFPADEVRDAGGE